MATATATQKPLDPLYKTWFAALACDLSPENLTCDGMLSRTDVAKRHKALMAEWAKLERELGRKVDEMEVW